MSARSEMAAQVKELRDQGMTGIAIAEQLGISRSYAYELITDPAGLKVKARKRSYAGTCERCGDATDGSGGSAMAPKVCQGCIVQTAEDKAERILEEFRRGDPIKAIAARLGMTVNEVRSVINNRRYRHGDSRFTLRYRPRRELWPLIERRWREGATAREIAQEAGTRALNVHMMVQSMRRAGIDLPVHTGVYESRRALIESRWAEGASMQEIADELGVSRVAVSSQIAYMRRKGVHLPYRCKRRVAA